MRLHDFLDYQARERPDAPFAVEADRCITYREARTQVDQLANALIDGGLGVGDRIAVLAKNSIEYVLLYFAAAKAGVVPVPLNTWLAPAEWAYIITDAGARLLLAGPEFVQAVDGIRGDLPTVGRFIALDAPHAAGWEDYRGWVAASCSTPPDRAIGGDLDLYQMYTSGTTGRSKGAVLTHRAVIAQMLQIGLVLRGAPGERWLLVAPLFHAAGANVAAFQGVYAGGCLVVQADFNPVRVVQALSEDGVAVALLVPAMIQACLAAVPDIAQRRYPRLRTLAYGASPIAEATLRRAMEVFGCDFVQGYGMTETCAGISFLSAADHRRAVTDKPELLLSAGRPFAGTEVRVVDAQDHPLPAGQIGEIVTRGPQLMRGYWNRPDATAEVLRGGWMHTGDAGMMDAEGYLYIQDRVKDMIVSGGENVYPREVEAVLSGHPAVADAAVIGVPDERWGETVKAVVVLQKGATATAEALIDFCRDKLGGYKRPRSVDFVDALPRNLAGKVLKRELRERYWAGHQRRVGGA